LFKRLWNGKINSPFIQLLGQFISLKNNNKLLILNKPVALLTRFRNNML